MLTKNFSTQTVESSSCWFRRDYSYRTNPNTCLGCEFCYKKVSNDKERRRSSTYIDTNEAFHSKTIFKTPVIISRFCEPFIDGASTEASISVAEKCIANNCQFIFKTALKIPDRAKELLIANRKNSQIQLRFVSNDSVFGDSINNELSGYEKASVQLLQAKELLASKVDTVALFDPYIIGVNDTLCKMLILQLAKVGIKKLIIKQLFATDDFVNYLKLRSDRRHVDLLCNNTSGYKTYNNFSYIKSLLPILEECEKYKITVSVCSNRTINEIVYGDRNCCQLKNPNGYYDENGKIINDK